MLAELMSYSWSDWLFLVLGLYVVNELYTYFRDEHAHREQFRPPDDCIAFDDYVRGQAYKRRYEDRNHEIVIQILPTANPMGGDTPTLAVVIELTTTGAQPPNTLFFWIDGVEWPLDHDGRLFALGGGRTAVEFYGLVEESRDITIQHVPMLKRIPY